MVVYQYPPPLWASWGSTCRCSLLPPPFAAPVGAESACCAQIYKVTINAHAVNRIHQFAVDGAAILSLKAL